LSLISRLVRRIAAPLAVEGYRRIAGVIVARRRGRVLAPETLLACPGFQQRAADGEVPIDEVRA